MRFAEAKPVLSLALLVPLFLLAACGGGGGESGGGSTIVPAPGASTTSSDTLGSSDNQGPLALDPVPSPPVGSDQGGSASGGTSTDPGPVASSGGVDGKSRGPAPLNLRSAGNFALLAETSITTVSPSVINGNVGLSPASAINLGLGCPPVTGALYTVDGTDPLPCQIVDPGLLSLVVGDGHAAWHLARDGRLADFTEVGDGNIGGMTLAPATYRWSTGVQIPADLTLSGGPNDVWIFVIESDLVVGPDVQIVLTDGAAPENIFWVTLVDNVEIGAGARFQGVILAETFIEMKTGASINGRLLAAQGIILDGNTITQP
jgi:Ice-binding-like